MSLTNPKSSEVEVIKVFGGPGTGKTTTIVGNDGIDDFQGILQQMFQNRPAESLMLIAYTRSAADEAKDRLHELTDETKKTLDNRITTIHSLTMGQTGIRPSNIVEIRRAADKYNFCNGVGLQYESQADNDDMMDVPDDEGHILFRILSWLKSNRKPVSEWEDCPISSAWLRGDEIETFAQQWEGWKSNRGIYEFDDVIEKAVEGGYTVNADELFVDEVQDLYPLQQAYLDNQLEVVDRVWMAGDDDQTIYEWAGANPDYFIETDGKTLGELDETFWEDKSGYWEDEGVYILDQSFRMPSRILRASQLCIDQVDERQEKQINPMGDGGEVIHLDFPSDEQLVDMIDPDDTFILCRANFQCNTVGRKLIDAGIPFQDRFKTWRKSTVQLRDATRAMFRDEDTVEGDAAHQLVSELDNALLTGDAVWGSAGEHFQNEDEVSIEEVKEVLDTRAPTSPGRLRNFVDKFQERNYFQKEAIKTNILREKGHMVPDGITIETIHWSKGQEAGTVILSLDTTQSVLQNTGTGIPDAERRLLYVGMTRAKEKLVLAEGMDPNSPSFTPEQLMCDDWVEEIIQ